MRRLEKNNPTIIFDARWIGEHGIGRFAREIRQRLKGEIRDLHGGDPVKLKSLISLELDLFFLGSKKVTDVFFSPSYNPPQLWYKPFIFTIHDLIHLDVPAERSVFKNIYYNFLIKSSVYRAHRVLTVSEYSRQRIIEWSGVAPEKVTVVGNGVDASFSSSGPVYNPGYPYIFYVCNSKPHKNVHRLVEAFSDIKFQNYKLLLTGQPDDNIRHLALRLGIYDRVVFAGRIPEEDLASYYRGAQVVTMPSLYEGFGLPALEGMACGVPVVVSNTTSLPEVVGDAGILVDPYSVESIVDGLTRALEDEELRTELKRRGIERAKLFNWDNVAAKVQHEIDLIGAK